MSILKFLLSPLLNEHGYTTLPTAQTASGKPVTTGIFANIKASLDSFNDGTGIADGVILPRHLFKVSTIVTRFNEAAAPARWATSIPANAAVDYYNIKNTRNTTRLRITVSGAVPPCIATTTTRYRLQTLSAYFSAVVSCTDITTTNEQVGFFLSSNGAATGGSTDLIGIYFDVANALIKTYVKAASSVHATVYSQAYTASTIYRFSIIANATSISFYIGSTLLGTYTTGLPAGTVDLYPVLGDINQATGRTGCDFNVYETTESLDDGLI